MPRPTVEEEKVLLAEMRRQQGDGRIRWYEMPLSSSRCMTLTVRGEPNAEEWRLALAFLALIVASFKEELIRTINPADPR